jgi:hypothetical protein
MEQVVNLNNWDSSPEPLLEIIASISGYQLHYINEPPAIAKSVRFSAKPRKLYDYINIIEQQTEGYIHSIIIDDKDDEKIIAVLYNKG